MFEEEGAEVEEERRSAGSVLRGWIGGRVELHYTAGSGGAVAGGAAAYGTSAGQPETRTGEYILGAVNELGLEAQSPNPEEGRVIFVPWHSVLLIEGPIPERPGREPALQEEDLALEDPELIPAVGEHGGEDERQDERQRLMDLLANARTPAEVAEARVEADAWLATRPSDGDVRAARDQLGDSGSQGADLEEGNPT